MMHSGAAQTAGLAAVDKPNFKRIATGLPGLQCWLG
jgi:hypothetical protein